MIPCTPAAGIAADAAAGLRGPCRHPRARMLGVNRPGILLRTSAFMTPNMSPCRVNENFLVFLVRLDYLHVAVVHVLMRLRRQSTRPPARGFRPIPGDSTVEVMRCGLLTISIRCFQPQGSHDCWEPRLTAPEDRWDGGPGARRFFGAGTASFRNHENWPTFRQIVRAFIGQRRQVLEFTFLGWERARVSGANLSISSR